MSAQNVKTLGALLVEALQFEFNLPYPDGSRMELVDDAVNAFKRRYEEIAV